MPKAIITPPNRWPYTETSKEVLFFALQMRECLHVKSWESYRVYSLSTIMRLSELRNHGQKVKRRSIPKETLKPMLEELVTLTSHDRVADSIVDFDLVAYCSIEFKYDRHIDDLISAASYLRSLLLRDYQRKCEELITALCFDSHNRIKLRNIAKLYAAFLINQGLSRKYVYEMTVQSFFGDDLQQIRRTKLGSYFQKFHIEKKKYRVFIGINKRFANLQRHLLPGRTYTDSTKIDQVLRQSFPANIGNGQKSAIIELSLNSYDCYSAFNLANQLIRLSQSLLFLYPHNASTKFEKTAYVVCQFAP